MDLGGVERPKCAEKYRCGAPYGYTAGTSDPFQTVSEGKFSEVLIAPVHYYTADAFCFAGRAGTPTNICQHKASHVEVFTLERQARTDKFTEVEDRYAAYTVYNRHYEKLGEVEVEDRTQRRDGGL